MLVMWGSSRWVLNNLRVLFDIFRRKKRATLSGRPLYYIALKTGYESVTHPRD